MQLDKLQLDLRPRPHWQAIDLGFALLRESVGTVYAAWLTLWLPLVGLCYALALWLPVGNYYWLFLAWWLRPLLERIVVFILSRAVFGEQVSWRAALRAWPGELRRGWFRVLTYWRPFVAGRGLYQPIWQLEQATGSFAADRRRVIGRDKAGRAAYWFGIACANFEGVLQLGCIALIGLFFTRPDAVNPILLVIKNNGATSPGVMLLSFVSYGIAAGIIGPIYSACTFTLYLNRRAELEAWDIELVLRQLTPRGTASALPKSRLALLALPLLLLAFMLPGQPAMAAECRPPEWLSKQAAARGAAQNAQQGELRRQLDALYADPDLRGYRCVDSWEQIHKDKQTREKANAKPSSTTSVPTWLPDVFKMLLIGGSLALLAWLLYRYRDSLAALLPRKKPAHFVPSEIAGLDIRPESLPDDVPTAVRKLWAAGRQRKALALLYRATLSRLAHRAKLELSGAATENECLALVQAARHGNRLSEPTLAAVTTVTHLWLAGAYADRLPADMALEAACTAWQAQFDGKVAA